MEFKNTFKNLIEKTVKVVTISVVPYKILQAVDREMYYFTVTVALPELLPDQEDSRFSLIGRDDEDKDFILDLSETLKAYFNIPKFEITSCVLDYPLTFIFRNPQNHEDMTKCFQKAKGFLWSMNLKPERLTIARLHNTLETETKYPQIFNAKKKCNHRRITEAKKELEELEKVKNDAYNSINHRRIRDLSRYISREDIHRIEVVVPV